MNLLPIAQASEATGWSARMLRYVEQLGLVVPERSGGGYRLYGPGQLQRLRTLRHLLDQRGVSLAEVGFAARLRTDPDLRAAIEAWLTAVPERPGEVPPADWLRWEQDKLQRLLAAAPGTPSAPDPSIRRASPAPSLTTPRNVVPGPPRTKEPV